MGRKRDSLVEGEYDQITDACPRMQRRFSHEVLRDVGAWLLMQWSRHADRATAARGQLGTGNDAWATGVLADADKCCDVVQEMFSRIHERWSVKDWHAAQEMLDMMVSARGPDGKPLHALGAILSSPERSSDGTSDSHGGSGVAIDPGLPPVG